MTLRRVFAPLLRALTGGRFSTHNPVVHPTSPPLGGAWVHMLAQLGLPPTTFEDVLATRSLHPHFHYRHFTVPKKHGGHREICEPDSKLKQIQRQILAVYLDAEVPHSAAMAYRPRRSIADHVWPHAGADVLITADVQDFFPNTTADRVEDWWRSRVSDQQAVLLTLLTTYQGALPQGAPTSPALSNLINRALDERLMQRASAAGATYTRFCDDMVFSWRLGLEPPSDFETSVRGILGEFGYVLHSSKGWHVWERHEEPEITGVILTRRGGVRLRADMQQTMQTLRQSNDPLDAQKLAGYRGFAAMVRKRPRMSEAKAEPTPAPAPSPRHRPELEDDIPF